MALYIAVDEFYCCRPHRSLKSALDEFREVEIWGKSYIDLHGEIEATETNIRKELKVEGYVTLRHENEDWYVKITKH
jgi:hypothetical protein